MGLFAYLQRKNALWKAAALTPYLKDGIRILDFGCGDLSLAVALKRKLPKIAITGVDVEDIKKKQKGVTFVRYDGEILPFKDNTFDVVISVYVFHHCQDLDFSLQECMRVAKNKIVFIEAIPRYSLDIYGMRLMDWLYNIWKPAKVPLPYHFNSIEKWKTLFKRYNVTFNYKPIQKSIFNLLPIGKGYIFEIEKNL